jgi:hypothetical protein
MNQNEKKAYEQGRLDEAEIALGNLYIILDQMSEQPNETDHIKSCIRDLEKATNKTRKDFEDEYGWNDEES